MPHTESTTLGGLEPLAESTVLGGLVPRTEHAALGGFILTSTAFHDCCTHGPRIRIDGLFVFPGRLVARVFASVVTNEGCTGRGLISSAADIVFASGFAIHIESGTGSADALDAATPIAQPTPLSQVLHRRRPPSRPPVWMCPSPPFTGAPALPSSTSRRRTATATGNATLV